MKPRYVLAPEAASDLVEIWSSSNNKLAQKLRIMWNLLSANGSLLFQGIPAWDITVMI